MKKLVLVIGLIFAAGTSYGMLDWFGGNDSKNSIKCSQNSKELIQVAQPLLVPAAEVTVDRAIELVGAVISKISNKISKSNIPLSTAPNIVKKLVLLEEQLKEAKEAGLPVSAEFKLTKADLKKEVYSKLEIALRIGKDTGKILAFDLNEIATNRFLEIVKAYEMSEKKLIERKIAGSLNDALLSIVTEDVLKGNAVFTQLLDPDSNI